MVAAVDSIVVLVVDYVDVVIVVVDIVSVSFKFQVAHM